MSGAHYPSPTPPCHSDAFCVLGWSRGGCLLVYVYSTAPPLRLLPPPCGSGGGWWMEESRESSRKHVLQAIPGSKVYGDVVRTVSTRRNHVLEAILGSSGDKCERCTLPLADPPCHSDAFCVLGWSRGGCLLVYVYSTAPPSSRALRRSQPLWRCRLRARSGPTER